MATGSMLLKQLTWAVLHSIEPEEGTDRKDLPDMTSDRAHPRQKWRRTTAMGGLKGRDSVQLLPEVAQVTVWQPEGGANKAKASVVTNTQPGWLLEVGCQHRAGCSGCTRPWRGPTGRLCRLDYKQSLREGSGWQPVCRSRCRR